MEASGRSVIAVLGGTGPQGRGLALRFASAGHEMLVGSRQRDRGEKIAAELVAGNAGLAITGTDNLTAARRGEIVFIAVPYEGQADLLPGLTDAIGDKIVINVVNPLAFDDIGPRALAVAEGSAVEQAARLLPRARMVSAFHDVSAKLLGKLSHPLDTDVLICGDDEKAKRVVIALANELSGMRGVDAGPLRNSGHLEALTAVLLGINQTYRIQSGIRITGLPPA
ncbi:MAG: NADPH-dependent F420 reductase [Actinomycetota bacterium]